MANNVCLIFGSTGQDGAYLNKLLLPQGHTIINISRKGAAVNGDVGDYSFVTSVVKKYQPAFIFHFAANSTTKHFALFDNHHAISTGTLNILEAVRLFSPASKVFLSGSAMQFKNGGLPISETTDFEASSPYSVARIHAVYAARYYRKAFDLKVYVGYFFNHDSPLRTEQHVNQKIAKAVKRIMNGSEEKLVLGNIEVQKEFNYAADVVNAVWILVNQDKVFEVVIGSGQPYSIKDWLKECFGWAGLNWEDHVNLEPGFIPEYDILTSNPRLICSLGWQPAVEFKQLAKIMMENA